MAKSKPTPLEEVLAHYQTKGPDTIAAAAIYDAARKELRVKTELCEAYDAVCIDAHGPDWDEVRHVELCDTAWKNLDAYRTWLAGREGSDGE